jgi:NAD(P)-dependent dehydrogenase (short-subunit alcohol dehydrogenase family)
MTEHAPFDLTGQVAVVYGASSGIGARFAAVLAAAGATVIAAARRRDRLDALSREITARGNGVCEAASCDMADPSAVADVIDMALRRYGRLDIAVQCAGVDVMKKALQQTLDDFDHVMDVNLRGAFVACQAAASAMLPRRYGRIVNVSSVNALRAGLFPLAPYSASKAGLCGLTRALAREWAPYGITVNSILPGFVETEMSLRSAHGATPEQIEQARRKGAEITAQVCPLGRMGQPEDMDTALLFLTSPASAYVTGQDIAVDGGLTIA